MKKALSSIILALTWNIPTTVLAHETTSFNQLQTKQAILLAGRGGGGFSGGGFSGGGFSRGSTGFDNRPDFSSDRTGSNRIDTNNYRSNTFENNNRNFNLNKDQNYSNRVQSNYYGNRNSYNYNNYGNRYNVNYYGNRPYINNPAGWNNWGWHGGAPWYPNYGYWGGGFWGAFAAGAMTTAVTGAVITAASQPQYVIVETGTPGYTLLNNYGLTQTRCGGNVVIINGPSGSVICAIPTVTVPIGTYTVEPSNLTLIPQY